MKHQVIWKMKMLHNSWVFFSFRNSKNFSKAGINIFRDFADKTSKQQTNVTNEDPALTKRSWWWPWGIRKGILSSSSYFSKQTSCDQGIVLSYKTTSVKIETHIITYHEMFSGEKLRWIIVGAVLLQIVTYFFNVVFPSAISAIGDASNGSFGDSFFALWWRRKSLTSICSIARQRCVALAGWKAEE